MSVFSPFLFSDGMGVFFGCPFRTGQFTTVKFCKGCQSKEVRVLVVGFGLIDFSLLFFKRLIY